MHLESYESFLAISAHYPEKNLLNRSYYLQILNNLANDHLKPHKPACFDEDYLYQYRFILTKYYEKIKLKNQKRKKF